MKSIIAACNRFAPPELAVEGDNIGLIIGDIRKKVTGIVTALDVTGKAIDLAIKEKCGLIIVHHPPIYSPIKKIDPASAQGRLIYRLIKNDIAVFAMHTNLDSAPKGLNSEVSVMLGLKKIRSVKHKGIAYRTGLLPKKMDAKKLSMHVKKRLKLKTVRYCGRGGEIKKVAVCTGAGADFLYDAARRGAQALITGDIRHHNAVECVELGMTIIDAGHFGTERPMVDMVTGRLKKALAKSKKRVTIVGLHVEEPFGNV